MGHTQGMLRFLRAHRWARRLSLGVLVLVLFVGGLTGAAFAYVAYRNHQIHRVRVGSLQVSAGPNVGTQTFLMIGSTSRCVLNGKQANAFGSCAQGITGVNSDVVMLLRADQANHTVRILSIPRDLVLQNVRPGQFHKIDAALADGPTQLVKVIEQDFGIPINHFVELNFDSFQGIVNSIGGIRMYFPTPEKDLYSSLNIKTKGCHLLNGFEALAVVRARHLEYGSHLQYYDGSGDLGRIIRDHEFLRVLAGQVASHGLGNPISDNSLIGSIAPQLTVDSGLSVTDMINLVLTFHGISPSAVPQWTLPNIEDHADYMYQGYDYGSVVFPAYPQDQRVIDQFLGLSTPPSSSLPASSVTLSVVDGTANPAGTARASSKLSALGFHVISGGSATPVGPVSEAIVYYKAGHLAQAQRVADSLTGIVSLAEGPTAAGANVTLVTGSNFSVVPLHPHHAAHPSPADVNPLSMLGPVSAGLQSLPWYDPRGC